jgi:hypothetical protein
MVKKHLNYSLCNCIKYNDYFQYLWYSCTSYSLDAF